MNHTGVRTCAVRRSDLRAAIRRLAVAFLMVAPLAAFGPAGAAQAEDGDGPRTAILCAYTPEWQALLPSITDRHDAVHAGVTFVTGRIGNAPVVLIESGISVVNATLSAQAAIDRYKIGRIVVMGISGGADPDLHIGDVVIPEQWRQYLESIFAREQDGSYKLPDWAAPQTEHFGMIFPQPVEIPRPTGSAEKRAWFPVDAHLLSAARAVPGDVALDRCTAAQSCLTTAPRLVVGGNGVSGPAFVDNAAFRQFARNTFQADAIDMETAAVAQVAYMNGVPFLAIRSLSDLAGGGAGANEMKAFEGLASKNAVTVLKALLGRVQADR